MLSYNNEAYARYEHRHPAFWKKIRGQKALEILKPKADDRVLEIGCNSGWMLSKLMKYSRNVVGIDVNIAGLKMGKMQNVVGMDVADMAFPDNFFDKIFCIHTIEHVGRIDKAFEEMSRVLKPTGSLLLMYPFEIIRGMCAIGGALAMCSSITKARELHAHKLRPGKIRKLLKGNCLYHKGSLMFPDPLPSYLSILEKRELPEVARANGPELAGHVLVRKSYSESFA
jgi:SAM-dependent methyltransferase